MNDVTRSYTILPGAFIRGRDEDDDIARLIRADEKPTVVPVVVFLDTIVSVRPSIEDERGTLIDTIDGGGVFVVLPFSDVCDVLGIDFRFDPEEDGIPVANQ